jgi:hypothetical protein
LPREENECPIAADCVDGLIATIIRRNFSAAGVAGRMCVLIE